MEEGAYVIGRCLGLASTIDDERRHEEREKGLRRLSKGSLGAWEMQSGHAGISGSTGWPPEAQRTVLPDIKTEGHCPDIALPLTFASSQSSSPSNSTSTTHIVIMSFDAFPEFNYDDLTWFENNSIYGDDLGFSGLSWDQSNVAGPSQPYTGVGVFGDFNYPDFPSPSTAPTSLYPTQGVPPDEGKLYRTY